VQQPEVCAQIQGREVLSDGSCQFEIFYKGTETVTLGSYVVAINDLNGNIVVPPSNTPYNLSVGTTSCLQVTCRQTINSTYVVLQTPSFSIISADDKALDAAIEVSLDQLMNNSLSRLNDVQNGLIASMLNISVITEQLNSIDFNMSQLYPYEDFTALRDQLDGIVSQVGENYCSSPFDSIMCWLKSTASILIAVGVCLVVIIIICVVLKKTNLGKSIKKNLFGKKDKDCAPTKEENTDELPIADKDKPTSEFQLLSTF